MKRLAIKCVVLYVLFAIANMIYVKRPASTSYLGQQSLTLSLRKNGATVSITFSNWQINGATAAESYFLLACSITS